jgi:O-acetyl-ADP-ribose deacetylase (regulator of RNase III)
MIRQLGSLTLKNNSVLSIVAGSVLEFVGDAIVNAANTGGINGGISISYLSA